MGGKYTLWGQNYSGEGSDGPGGIQIHYGGKFYSREHKHITPRDLITSDVPLCNRPLTCSSTST